MPSENMLVPLMIFLRTLRSFDKMSEEQRKFLEFWYWSAVFSNKYSSASNEAIIEDCEALSHVARSERISTPYYFSHLRPIIAAPDDLFSYTKRTSAIYRGVLNLVGYKAQGLKDWTSTHKLTTGMRLEDHHVYPRGYVAGAVKFDDLSHDEAEQLEVPQRFADRCLTHPELPGECAHRPPALVQDVQFHPQFLRLHGGPSRCWWL